MNDSLYVNKRRLKVLGDVSGVYQCMSRIVGGQALLGRREKEVLRKQIHALAEFCGVEVLTYAILSNHFHVLVRVPPQSQTSGVSERELVRRVWGLYPKDRAAAWEKRLRGPEREAAREQLLARMGDVSKYLREVKHRFSLWYNRTHGRYGTLWAERFKSVLVEPSGLALLAVACYIDLNAVRAGLCEDPKDYRWCGYAEACAGSQRAREGLRRVLGRGEGEACSRLLSDYRLQLYGRSTPEVAGKGAGLASERIAQERARSGQLSLGELLRCRVRYFTAGTAIGTREYVEAILREQPGLFGAGRKSGASRMKAGALREVFSLRNLQKEVVG